MQPNFKQWLQHFVAKMPGHFKGVLIASGVITTIVFSMVMYGVWSSNYDYKQSTFSRWEQAFQEVQQTNEYFLQRTPASEAEHFSCLSNKMDLAYLKNEVIQLETSYDSGKPVQGQWQGINLNTLANPQAQLLLDHSKFILKSDKNFSHCRDVICVLNEIYQEHGVEQNLESAYLSYYWYLKTGSFLSLVDIPFGYFELQNLWKLSHSLPESFFYLPSFKVVRKMVIADGAKCSELKSSGELHIQANCLKTVSEDKSNLIQYATIFLNVIDENKLIQKDAISYSDDWLKTSEWSKDEHIDSSFQYSYKWKHSTQEDLFVSDFSKYSPLDQLLSSVAHFRYNPEGVFSLKESFKSIIAKSFFEANHFDGNGLLEKYLSLANKTWDELESGFWVDCLNNHYDVDFIAKNKDRSQFQKLNSELYSCMDQKVPAFVSKVINHIKTKEYEGCHFLSSDKYKSYSDQLHDSLSKIINKRIFKTHFDLEKWGVEVLIGYKIKNTVVDEIDPTAIYVSCTTQKNMDQCYENRLHFHVEGLVGKFGKIHPDFLKQLKLEISDRFHFKKIMVQAESQIKRFLFPYYSQLRIATETSWNECIKQPVKDNNYISSYKPFDGGEYYVNPHMMNCINDKSHKLVGKILDQPVIIQFDKKRNLSFELKTGEKHYAHQHLLRRAIQYFNEYTASESVKDQLRMQEFFSQNNENIVYKIVGDEYFLKNIYSKVQIKDRCLEIISKYYPNQTHFNNKSIIEGKFGQGICQEVLKNGKVQRAVASTIENEWTGLKQTMMGDFKKKYQKAIDDCYDRYPTKLSIDLVKNSQMRQTCLEIEHEYVTDKLIGSFRNSKQADYFLHKESELKRDMLAIKLNIIEQMKSTEALIR